VASARSTTTTSAPTASLNAVGIARVVDGRVARVDAVTTRQLVADQLTS
jgi:hypothetical protein